jgi:phage gpG-like protein
MRLTLEVFGDVQLDRKLLRFEDHVGDLEPAFEALADDFLSIETRQFSSEGGFASGGWAPLADSTVQRRGSAHPILDDHGDLRASLTDAAAKGAIRDITSDSLFVGTDIDYAQYHQTGTARMPRRRPVEFRDADRRRWVKGIQRYLTTGQAEVGL